MAPRCRRRLPPTHGRAWLTLRIKSGPYQLLVKPQIGFWRTLIYTVGGGGFFESGWYIGMMGAAASRYVIRRIRLAHCKRGPAVCAQCREMGQAKICLLDISPPHPGEIQRRVIEVSLGGEMVWREYDVVRVFETQEEAQVYAEEHAISDVELAY